MTRDTPAVEVCSHRATYVTDMQNLIHLRHAWRYINISALID